MIESDPVVRGVYLVTWARSGGDERDRRWEADLLNQSPVLSSSRNTLLFVAPARSAGAELTRKVALRALAKKQLRLGSFGIFVPACLFGTTPFRKTTARRMLHPEVLTDDRFAGRLNACFWVLFHRHSCAGWSRRLSFVTRFASRVPSSCARSVGRPRHLPESKIAILRGSCMQLGRSDMCCSFGEHT